jgi:tight adherence protein B
VGSLLIVLAAFVGVAALVGGVAMLLFNRPNSRVEDRLGVLTGTAAPPGARDGLKEGSLLSRPLDDVPGMLDSLFERFGNMDLIFEQADTSLTMTKLAAISVLLGVIGTSGSAIAGIHPALAPLTGMILAALPLAWVLRRRKKRLKAFGAQLPDALEMMSRTLRAGQSLGFGFSMVGQEMPAPLGREFSRVFEEQNLGVPMDESLQGLARRVPNMDLHFFVTALVLQRQTGGDLAEILDKIGALIRDRFRIWGQIQALTGEGRLSGVVLLGLPFLLLIAVYNFNPDYIKVLFTDPMGKKMLVVAALMQILGALVIRKIVNIKV